MDTIKTFLATKGVSVDQLATWPDDQCRAVAKAMGFAQPDVSVSIEPYTRQDGKTFLYVKAGVKGSRNGIMAQVNAGDTLTLEGKAKARALLTALCSGAQAALDSIA
jgi:hypothetical protein